MKKTFYVAILFIIGLLSTITIMAISENYSVYEKGQKNYKNSHVYTYYNGTIKTPVSLFGQTSTFKGHSRSAWMGYDPYNADDIIHTDSISIHGVGGISAGSSEVSATISGNTANFSRSVSNHWYIETDYTYTLSSWLIFAVSQKSSAEFRFSNTFVIVDSKGDNVSSTHGYWIS